MLTGRREFQAGRVMPFFPTSQSCNMTLPACAIWCLLLSLLGGAFPVAGQAPKAIEPAASRAFIVVDTTTKKIILSHEPDTKLPVGSLAAIATACVADDWLEATKADRNVTIVVPPEAAQVEGGNPLNLLPGDYLSIRDAMFSTLIGSDNIAALALANQIGLQMWRQDGGKAKSAIDFFVAQMNALAESKAMTRTVFTSPHGMDDRRGVSTAADMARLTLYAIQKPSLNFIVRQEFRDVTFMRNGQPMNFRLFNTNKLLGQEGIEGFKTGRTARSGECFVASARRPDEVRPLDAERMERIPYHLITITLNSTDRFQQTLQLIVSGFAEYERWVKGTRQLMANEVLATAN